MHWYEYGMVMLAMVLAIISDLDARAAMRASVATYLRATAGDKSPYYMTGLGWVRTYELRKMFGPFVYPALRHLHDNDVLERSEETLSGHQLFRDGYPSVLYRWKQPLREPDA